MNQIMSQMFSILKERPDEAFRLMELRTLIGQRSHILATKAQLRIAAEYLVEAGMVTLILKGRTRSWQFKS